LWLRGSIFQFRVRVPIDLREAFGRDDLSRSLGTDSLSLAIRLARKCAAEIEVLFEEKRRAIGLPFDQRLIASTIDGNTAVPAILGRSADASQRGDAVDNGGAAASTAPTLGEVYGRYLSDPTKRRSDRTMLAHHTTGRVVEDFFGAAMPLADHPRGVPRTHGHTALASGQPREEAR
jgi:hypothetical protein